MKLVALFAVACGAPAKPTTPIANSAPAKQSPSATIEIWTTIVADATQQPISGAAMVVLRPGADVKQVDPKLVDKDVLSRGRSDAKGVVHLSPRIPVPGTYGVVVTADGYEPLVGHDELRLQSSDLPKDLARPFDPWGKISLLTVR